MRISDWSSDVCSSDLHVIGDLVDDLVALLQARGIGLRTAVLTCLRVDGGEQRIGLGTAKATREPTHLKRIIAMRIEQIEPGLGIEAMTLAAPRCEYSSPTALRGLLPGEDRPPDQQPLI